MKSPSRLTLFSFLLAIATLAPPLATAATHLTEGTEDGDDPLSIDRRISRVTGALEQRAHDAGQSLSDSETEGLGAAISSFVNRRGGGGFVNRPGGSFANGRPSWGNGFRNGGGFFNRRW